MTDNGFAIRRNPCLRCEDKDLCGICELNILRRKEVNKMDESKMMACSCKPYNEFEETVQMMLSEDYKARFVAEYRQTKIRYERLNKFCCRIEAARRSGGKLDMPKHDCPEDLLRDQQAAMGNYLHILEVRAQIEGVEL